MAGLTTWLMGTLVVLCYAANFGLCRSEPDLVDWLRYNYRIDAKPEVKTGNQSKQQFNGLVVNHGVSLVDIVKVDTSLNTLDLVIWETLSWQTDMSWDDDQSEARWNISTVRIPADQIWIPDVTIFNLVSPAQRLTDKNSDYVLVSRTGQAVYVPPKRITTSCDFRYVDSEMGETCSITVGSWTYTGNDIDPHLFADQTFMDLNNYNMGSKFEVLNSTAVRNVVYYTCCPNEPYVDIKYFVNLRRRDQRDSFLENLF